jgi:hypothetical protein
MRDVEDFDTLRLAEAKPLRFSGLLLAAATTSALVLLAVGVLLGAYSVASHF